MIPKNMYKFSIVTYAGQEAVEKVIAKGKKWAYIIHDRDKADTHIHLLISFDQRKTFEQVRKMFDSDQNTLVQYLQDTQGAYRYLTHEGEAEKEPYGEDEIITNDREYFKGKSESGDREKNMEFVEDLLNEEMTYREMAYKYGRDYMKNVSAYEKFRDKVIIQEALQDRKKAIRAIQEFVENNCLTCQWKGTMACETIENCMTRAQAEQNEIREEETDEQDEES